MLTPVEVKFRLSWIIHAIDVYAGFPTGPGVPQPRGGCCAPLAFIPSVRTQSSRLKSPLLVPEQPRADGGLEAQTSAVSSTNPEGEHTASSVTYTSPAHTTIGGTLSDTFFDGVQDSKDPASSDLTVHSRNAVLPIADELGRYPPEVPSAANIPLPSYIKNLSSRIGSDSELQTTASGDTPYIAVEADGEDPVSNQVLNRSSATDGNRKTASNEDVPSLRNPLPLSAAFPTAGQKDQDKSGSAETTSDPWTKCAEAVWVYEKNRVDRWKEDINNLLLFAGLFSTVLTGFIVPYYVLLHMQQPDASVQALLVISSQLVAISSQLTAFANGPVYFNVTQPIIPSRATVSPTPPTSHTTVLTSTLWFVALVCSLAAASIGISVSQWLHHHGDQTTSSSRQSIRIWYFRDRGFVEWGVQDIINVLPLLLQVSVTLFLVGLLELLWTMDILVAGVVTSLAAVVLMFSMGTAFIPAFAPRCPYKSPQAWWWFLILRSLSKHLERLTMVRRRYFHAGIDAQDYLLRYLWHFLSLPLSTQSFHANMPKFSSWRDFEYFFVRSQAEEDKDKLKMMVHADEILTDETSLPDIISPCVTQSDSDSALPAFYAIMQRRAHDWKHSGESNQPELIWYQVDSDAQLVIALGDMTISMFTRISSSNLYFGDEQVHQLHILRILDKLLSAMPNTQGGAAVYFRLCDLADTANLSNHVREKIAELKVASFPDFEDHIEDYRPVLSAVSLCKDLDPERFSTAVISILKGCAKLPRTDFAVIHDELQEALAAIVEYYRRRDAQTLADLLTNAPNGWSNFYGISDACLELVEADALLFTPEMVDDLERFSLLCPSTSWTYRIRSSMTALRDRVRQRQNLTDVIPTANDDAASRSDP